MTTGSLPKALLVDMDDTVIMYGAASVGVWREVCRAHASELPGWSVDELVEGIDSYRRWFWADPDRHRRGRLADSDHISRQMVLGAFERMGIDAPEVGRRMGDRYTRRRYERIRPFPGAIDALVALREAGVRLALVTNGDALGQRDKIDRFDLERYFDCVLVEGEFGAGKPDERVYLHALECLDAQPSEAWMIGDNLEWEVAAPQRLGIKGIWHDHDNRGLPPNSDITPDRIVQSLTELVES